MFSGRYDHQTEAKTGAVTCDDSDKHQLGLCPIVPDLFTFRDSMCHGGFVLSDCLSRAMITLLASPVLLLDQIKPIEQLVPVS